MGVKDKQASETWWEEEATTKKTKKSKKAAAEDDSWWEEEAPAKKAKSAKKAKAEDGAAAPKKTANHVAATPEDLVPGTVVLYWDGWRGTVRDAFIPINQFWITDEESGELVADDSGNLVQFKAEELELVAPPPIAKPRPLQLRQTPLGGVMVLGSEQQMLEALQHFGCPDGDVRNDPQHLLAMPCDKCDPQSILQTASEGVDTSVRELAQKLRPDIHVALRAYHLKQAVESLGASFLKLDGWYCLSAVQLPFSQDDINESRNTWERHWRSEVCNQIDVCVTAGGSFSDEFTAGDAAKRSLGEQCGIVISETIWEEDVQRAIRRSVSAERLPMQFTDANSMRVTVLMLPMDAIVSHVDGTLRFDEDPSVDYTTLDGPSMSGAETREVASSATAKSRARPPAAVAPAQQQQHKVGAGAVGANSPAAAGRKNAREWESQQDQFAGLPPLPPNWIRIKSKSNGEVYFFNTKTHESTFDMPEMPLPEGWTKQVSKSTGKTYYFNARKNQSQFTRPIE